MNKDETRNSLFEMMTSVPPGMRAVFFDAVGTLINPEPIAPVVYAEAGQRYGSRLGVESITERFRAAFQREEVIDRANGWRTSEVREIARWRRIVGTVLDDVVDAVGCFQELFDHFSRPESWRCDAALAVILPGLAARGYKLGIASNYDQRLRCVLSGLPALAPLDHLVISAEVGWRKPAPQFFAALCAQVHLHPQEILLIGNDPANDYDGARAAGLNAMLISRPTSVS
jgi:putative hydrolase of the HAD superfamily